MSNSNKLIIYKKDDEEYLILRNVMEVINLSIQKVAKIFRGCNSYTDANKQDINFFRKNKIISKNTRSTKLVIFSDFIKEYPHYKNITLNKKYIKRDIGFNKYYKSVKISNNIKLINKSYKSVKISKNIKLINKNDIVILNNIKNKTKRNIIISKRKKIESLASLFNQKKTDNINNQYFIMNKNQLNIIAHSLNINNERSDKRKPNITYKYDKTIMNSSIFENNKI